MFSDRFLLTGRAKSMPQTVCLEVNETFLVRFAGCFSAIPFPFGSMAARGTRVSGARNQTLFFLYVKFFGPSIRTDGSETGTVPAPFSPCGLLKRAGGRGEGIIRIRANETNSAYH
jgi:hypothetical protein